MDEAEKQELLSKSPAETRVKKHSPWQVLSTAFSVAISPVCLFLSALGEIASTIPPLLLGWISEHPPVADLSRPSAAFAQLLGLLEVTSADQFPPDPVVSIPRAFVLPWWNCFQIESSWYDRGCFFLLGLASILIWSFFGLAICRIAVFRCGRRGKDLSLRRATEFAKRKWSAVAGAPLASIATIVMIGLPVVVCGWIVRFDFGFFLMSALWGVVLAVSLLMGILALGLLFGWPLMWAAIAAEDSDLFDAIGRSCAYVYQHPLKYFWYVLQAAILGFFGWLAVCCLAEMVVHLAHWAVSLTGGAERAALLGDWASAKQAGGWIERGANLNGIWPHLLRGLVGAFSFSYFWCATAAVYLLMRYDADETELDDIVASVAV